MTRTREERRVPDALVAACGVLGADGGQRRGAVDGHGAFGAVTHSGAHHLKQQTTECQMVRRVSVPFQINGTEICC